MKNLKMPLSILLCAFLLFLAVPAAGALDPKKVNPNIQIDPNLANPNAIVSIPDSNLNKFLHSKTGIALSKPIRRVDLYGLSGSLEPKDKNISNAEGIEYCTGIEKLDMSGNKLSSMPDTKDMAKLKTLVLSGNKFASVPEEICSAPKLESLDISGNVIESLADGFYKLTNLKELNLSGNKLAEFPAALTALAVETLDISGNAIGSLPDNISKMAGLKYFTAADCNMTTLPDKFYSMTWLRKINFINNEISGIEKNIKNLGSLESISLDGNKLDSLPNEICSLSKLKTLSVNANALTGLPAKIGDLKLEKLSLNKNSITALPASISDITTLKWLDVRLNRLKKLPTGLDKLSFEYINVEWNFIDMSDNSTMKKMMDNTSATTDKLFVRQLTPLQNPTASSDEKSITLYWDKCADGEENDGTWTVSNYTVYTVSGDTTGKIVEIAPTTASYTVLALLPSTIYTYKVSVEYKVSDSGTNFEGTTKDYAEIEARTADSPPKPAPSPTPLPSSKSTATFTPFPSPALSIAPSAAEATVSGWDENSGETGLLYTALAAVSLIAVTAIVLVIIILIRKKPRNT